MLAGAEVHELRRKSLTLFPGLSNDISSTFAHHLGDVQGTVGLVGNGDGSVHSLCLHLGNRGDSRSGTPNSTPDTLRSQKTGRDEAFPTSEPEKASATTAIK